MEMVEKQQTTVCLPRPVATSATNLVGIWMDASLLWSSSSSFCEGGCHRVMMVRTGEDRGAAPDAAFRLRPSCGSE